MARILRPAAVPLLAVVVAIPTTSGASSPVSPGAREADRLVERAREFVDEGHREEAVNLLLATGDRWTSLGLTGPATVLLEEAARLSPSPGVWALLGRALALEEDFFAARPLLLRAVEGGVDDLRTILYLAASSWEVGELDEAEALFRRAIRESGRASLPRHQLGRLLTWQGRYDESLELLRPLAVGSRSPDLLLDVARAADGAGETEEAFGLYRRVLEVAPGLANAYYGAARALLRLGRREEGEAMMEEFRRRQREHIDSVREEGLLESEVKRALDLLRRSRLEEAEAILDRLPETADVLAARGVALLVRGEPEAAEDLLSRAVASAPDRRDLRSRLAEARLASEGGG